MYCCPGGCDTTFPVSEHFQPAGTKEKGSYVTWVCILEEGGGGGFVMLRVTFYVVVNWS